MAKFDAELPLELMQEIEQLDIDTERMMQEMTHSAAEVVRQNVLSNIDSVFSGDTTFLKENLHVGDYKSPSDDGVNTKVYFSGYAENSDGKTVPVPLVAQAREYGTRSGEQKRPFFRKSFRKAQITTIMESVQKRFLPHE